MKYSSIVDEELKRIVKKEKEKEDCSFDDIGIPICVSNAKDNSMKYEKYYIVYYGNDEYKVIYDIKDIKYLDKMMK